MENRYFLKVREMHSTVFNFTIPIILLYAHCPSPLTSFADNKERQAMRLSFFVYFLNSLILPEQNFFMISSFKEAKPKCHAHNAFK